MPGRLRHLKSECRLVTDDVLSRGVLSGFIFSVRHYKNCGHPEVQGSPKRDAESEFWDFAQHTDVPKSTFGILSPGHNIPKLDSGQMRTLHKPRKRFWDIHVAAPCPKCKVWDIRHADAFGTFWTLETGQSAQSVTPHVSVFRLATRRCTNCHSAALPQPSVRRHTGVHGTKKVCVLARPLLAS